MTRAEYNDNIPAWSGHVLRFAVWNCGDRMRGEDAMQEAFTRLWEQRDSEAVEKGLPYLLTVARRYLVDCFRHDAVAAKAHTEMAKSEDTMTTPGEASLVQNDFSDPMVLALSRLPELQRSIMQLRDVEGYSYKEIAQMLGINENQVQVYLFRARSTMKKMLTNTGIH